MIMIGFERPLYLIYLTIIPLIIITHFLLLERAKQKALIFANFETIKRVTGEKLLTKNITILVLRIIIIISLVFAISHPYIVYKTRTLNNNIVFAIDSSASMSSEDFYPSRLDVAKEVSTRIINNLNAYTKIGVVSFAGVTYIKTPLTDSKLKAINALKNIDIITAGGTDIPGAIISSTNLMMNTKGGKTIILFSDGSNTISYLLEDPIRMAIDYAKKNDVRVYTIGIGSEGALVGYLPSYYNITTRFDEYTLMKIANETNGKYYKYNNTESLVKDILAESREGLVRKDLKELCLFIGLIAFSIEWGLVWTRFRRIP